MKISESSTNNYEKKGKLIKLSGVNTIILGKKKKES